MHELDLGLLILAGSAILMGLIIGYAAGFALCKAEAKQLIEQPSILMFTTALALSTLALVELMGSNGILAVFCRRARV